MQIIGSSAIDDGINAIAQRSNRTVVSNWVLRVLKRHVRRDLSLVREVKDAKSEKKIIEAMKHDGLTEEVQKKILTGWKRREIKVCLHSKEAIAEFLNHAADTLDWIESLPDTDRRIRRIDRMSWKDAQEAASTWHEKLAKAKIDDNERMNGVVNVADFDDGMFMAKLVTDKALKAEGAMMGHCVGGYWGRVQTGKTAIYSLRDSQGFPHVTIEMSQTPEVRLSDGTTVRVGARPRPGVNYLHVTDSNWVAVQVRGKQNKKPVKKYLTKIVEWFDKNDVPWVEYGQEIPVGSEQKRLFVFNVGGEVGKNFSDPHQAHDLICNVMLERLKNPKVDFHFTYRSLGAEGLHQYLDSADVVQKFIDTVQPEVVKLFKNNISSDISFETAAQRSGVSTLVKLMQSFGLDHSDMNNTLFNELCKNTGEPSFDHSPLLQAYATDSVLETIVHRLPLSPLAMLANGYAAGKEAEVISIIRPILESSIKKMEAHPNSLHLVKSQISGVKPIHIKHAYLYCGLAQEYAAASEKVVAGVKAKCRDIRVSLKRSRGTSSTSEAEESFLRFMRNMFAEGYEKRLNSAMSSKFGDGLSIAFDDHEQQNVLDKKHTRSAGYKL